MRLKNGTAEDLLLADLIEAGYPPLTQCKFHPSRRWAIDFAYQLSDGRKFAIEVNGRGRHQTAGGEKADMQKENCAVEMGWRVLRYPASSVRINKRRARIVEQICRVLSGVECAESAGCVLIGD